MIARILRDESYVGTLICHKSERNKINKTSRFTEPEEQFRHENYLPPIITPELWEQTQMMLAERKRLNVRAALSQEILRYSGLLRCEDCGRANRGPASAATILNEERPLLSRRARSARLPDIQRSFLSGAPDRT